VAIGMAKGSGDMSINADKPVPTFNTMIRNTGPGSNAGVSGLSRSMPASLRSALRSAPAMIPRSRARNGERQ
jgi:hypothetical protein